MRDAIDPAALDLHRSAIVVDGHYDRLYPLLQDAHNDLDALAAGGVTAHIRQTTEDDVLPFLERTHQIVERWPDRFCIATQADHIRAAKRDNKIATIFSIEGVEPLKGDLTMLQAFYRLGLRNCGITWNLRNEAADGVSETRTGGGLTEFGVDLVQEMERLGIMLDISHLAPAGVRDVFEHYRGPVVASHANAQALCSHPRNLTDDQIHAVAQSDGHVGVTPVPKFVTEDPNDTTLDRFIAHIDHIAGLVGPEHVSIGSDWEGFEMIPHHFMRDISDLPVLTAGLLDKGYQGHEIEMILGGNWLRVFERVAG